MKKLVVGVVVIAAVACSKKGGDNKENKEGSGAGSGTAVTVESKGSGSAAPGSAAAPGAGSAKPAEPAPAASTIKVDPEIQKRVADIVTNCKVNVESWSVWECKGEEKDAIFKYIWDKKPDNAFESLTEIAVTEGAKDQKYLLAVVDTWPGFRDRDFTKKLSTPAAADRVLKLLPMLPPKADFNGAFIPLVAGKRAELTAVLAKLPADSKAKSAAIRDYLDWGGMEAFPDVQAFYKNATTDDERRAATSSVGHAIGGNIAASMGIQKWVTDADKPALCDWVKGIALDPATPEAAYFGAGDSLSRCKGTYIDDALNAIDARLKAEKLTSTNANLLQHMCWGEGLVGGSLNGTPAQCERAFNLLAANVTDKTLEGERLRVPLYIIGSMAEDTPALKKKAIAVLSKFTGHKDKDISDTAKERIAELKKK